jgi:hypothetical protein
MKRTRRTLSSEFKAKVALEAIKEIKTVSEIAQQYQIPRYRTIASCGNDENNLLYLFNVLKLPRWRGFQA